MFGILLYYCWYGPFTIYGLQNITISQNVLSIFARWASCPCAFLARGAPLLEAVGHTQWLQGYLYPDAAGRLLGLLDREGRMGNGVALEVHAHAAHNPLYHPHPADVPPPLTFTSYLAETKYDSERGRWTYTWPTCPGTYRPSALSGTNALNRPTSLSLQLMYGSGSNTMLRGIGVLAGAAGHCWLCCCTGVLSRAPVHSVGAAGVVGVALLAWGPGAASPAPGPPGTCCACLATSLTGLRAACEASIRSSGAFGSAASSSPCNKEKFFLNAVV